LLTLTVLNTETYPRWSLLHCIRRRNSY